MDDRQFFACMDAAPYRLLDRADDLTLRQLACLLDFLSGGNERKRAGLLEITLRRDLRPDPHFWDTAPKRLGQIPALSLAIH